MVSVQGPQEAVRRGDQLHNELGFISCQYVNAAFSSSERKKRKIGDRRGKEVENIVKQSFEEIIILDLYKRSEIMIIVHVFESDGSLICAIINATTLALIDAGIAMKDLLISCSVSIHKQMIYQDVTQIEQTSGSAYLPLAIQCNNKEIIYMQSDNRASVEMLELAMKSCVEGCLRIKTFF